MWFVVVFDLGKKWEVEHFAVVGCGSASVSENIFIMCAFSFLSVCGWVRESVCWMCSFDLKHSG